MTFELDTTEVRAATAAARQLPGQVQHALEPAALAPTLDPLRDRVAAAWTGPHAAVLAHATTIETSPALAVVTGGGGAVRSGGASASDLVFGVEFGGGRRRGRVRATGKRRAHTRATTNQFPAQTLAATRAVAAAADATGDAIADAVEQVIAGGH